MVPEPWTGDCYSAPYRASDCNAPTSDRAVARASMKDVDPAAQALAAGGGDV
jgi:hypothetical protein